MNSKTFGSTSSVLMDAITELIVPNDSGDCGGTSGDKTEDLVQVYEKVAFSMFPCPILDQTLTKCKSEGIEEVNIVLYGLLTEACILQTTLDLISVKYKH